MEPNFDTIFMTGPQGSGKGTQGKRLAAKLGFFSWDTGAELRAIAAQDTPLGHEVAGIINGGQFLSDEMLIRILEDRLPAIPEGKGIIFDGVPRRMGQAEYILGFLKSKPRKGMVTIHIDLPREESVKRLLLRAKTEGRVDDTPEAIDKRLQFFDEVIMPVMEVLKKETRYLMIDGRPSMDEVEKSIDDALGI
ncbi:MAG: nucleoside monophosphate kinase [Candidatus Pacebacteria bacterium]|nr:nucleoside monophosphate kinase [Candidatus Paceibacterota bacterium]